MGPVFNIFSLGKIIQVMDSFPGGSAVKNLHANVRDLRDLGLTLGLGRYPGEGNGNPFQFFLSGKLYGRWSLEGYSP